MRMRTKLLFQNHNNKFVRTKMRLKVDRIAERDFSDLSGLLDLSDWSDLSIAAFKKTRDGTTERRTDRRRDPHIEMRGRI